MLRDLVYLSTINNADFLFSVDFTWHSLVTNGPWRWHAGKDVLQKRMYVRGSTEKCTYDYLMTDEKLNPKDNDKDRKLRELAEQYGFKKVIEYLDEKNKFKAINAQSGNYSIESTIT